VSNIFRRCQTNLAGLQLSTTEATETSIKDMQLEICVVDNNRKIFLVAARGSILYAVNVNADNRSSVQ
jgi:hypothetical protein